MTRRWHVPPPSAANLIYPPKEPPASKLTDTSPGRHNMPDKQVVLITGASTGFGRLFTETLSRKGHTVFATMRDPNGKNAKNVAEIRTLAQKENLPIHVLERNVTHEPSVNRPG